MLSLLLALGAHADEAEEVRAFFDNYVKLEAAFEDTSPLLNDTARLVTLRDGTQRMEMTGAQIKAMMPKVLEIAKQRGDTTTYSDVSVAPHGEGYRVTATRLPAAKCVEDKGFHLDVASAEDRWTIVEIYTETVSLSQCKPSSKLAAKLKAIRKGILPHLPLDLDPDTRLEKVEIVGPNIVYTQHLHGVAAAELDLQQLVPMLQQIGLQSVCGQQEMKDLSDAGAVIRYHYIDKDRAFLSNVDVPSGICPK